MKILNRKEIEEEYCQEIFKKESHHNHEVIKDEDGIIRWKENKKVRVFLKNISLNDLFPLLNTVGYGKNSEVYRKIYRDMGYPLFGYWEIFYCPLNN